MCSEVAHLTLVLQGREVRKFALNPGATTIGRAQDNDIVINNLALSRRHAQVERRNGRYEVSDLQSQNGVYVNSERIRGSRVLSDADTITLGTYHFVFSDGDSAPEALVARPPRPAVEPSSRSERVQEREEVEHVPLLVLKYNDVELQRFPIKRTPCLIGRAKECDVQIAEKRLSRKHCEVVRGDDDRYYLKDLGSQNGTYVNRRRIGEFHELKDGDILNFAEYSVLYLADVAGYDGPDRELRRSGLGMSARSDASRQADIGREETAFPEAFEYGGGGGDVKVSDVPGDARGAASARAPVVRGPHKVARDPLTERPQDAKERRTGMRRSAQEPNAARAPAQAESPAPGQAPPATRRPLPPPAKDRRPKGDLEPERAEIVYPQEYQDVPDDAEELRPDPSLDEWYASRREASKVADAEDSSVLLRGKSSVSKVLSSMMVDRRELDRNLSVRARQRRFVVEVMHGSERIFSGPLTHPVTILGTDREADIKLKGRYITGRHSILVRVRDSLLLVRLGSSSAARVNGFPKLQAFLKSGDTIQIDETTIRIFEE